MIFNALYGLINLGFLLCIVNAGFPTNTRASVPMPLDIFQDVGAERSFFNKIIGLSSSGKENGMVFDINWNAEQDVTFYLYTRKNPNNGYILKVGDSLNVKMSPLKPMEKTIIIIHGWTDSSKINWLSNFRNNYLAVGNYNVIIVNWFPTSAMEYSIASKLTNPIGQYVGKMLDFLKTETNISLSDVHILGHSLGAHIAGFAGSFLSGTIGRITGMDPARPGFESPIFKNQNERLDPSDAVFVDVIHTCAGTVGFIRAIGHVDFYPNGGTFRQPGCSPLLSQYCSHGRSYQFMAESIIYPEEFVAIKCDSWTYFKAGKCQNNSRAFMGEKVSSHIRGLYFLETREAPPYGKGNLKYSSFSNDEF